MDNQKMSKEQLLEFVKDMADGLSPNMVSLQYALDPYFTPSSDQELDTLRRKVMASNIQLQRDCVELSELCARRLEKL